MKVKGSIEIKKEERIKWPKVAIIILNWNGWEDTIECLESVFRNTYQNYQVIVVDNGSTNGSIEKIKAWAEGKREVLTPESTHPLYHLSHPLVKKPIPYIYYTREEAEKGSNFRLEEKVTKEWQEQKKSDSEEINPTSSHPLILIQTGENLGFAAGNNIGIRFACKKDTDYILLLNNDTVIDKYVIRKFINFYIKNKNKKIGIITGMIKEYNKPNVINYMGGKLDYRIPHSIFGRHINRNKKYLSEKLLSYYKTDFVSGSFIFISTNIFKKEKMLDESFFFGDEDHEFCYRLIKKGYSHYLIPNCILYHKIGSTRRISSEQIYNGAISSSILWKKILSKFKWWCLYIYYISYSFLLLPLNYGSKYLRGMNLNIFLFIKLQFIIYIDMYKLNRITLEDWTKIRNIFNE